MSGVSGARAHLSYFQPESLILAMCHVFKLARVAKRENNSTSQEKSTCAVRYDRIRACSLVYSCMDTLYVVL